ncbi:hypothetical protein [Brachybacterium sp. GPGPB12]|uniref:hypothetical protein n=1 Tax=Brachybacterium sp. GPGPB12 TaxID=3023517 RepID=UPI003134534B
MGRGRAAPAAAAARRPAHSGRARRRDRRRSRRRGGRAPRRGGPRPARPGARRARLGAQRRHRRGKLAAAPRQAGIVEPDGESLHIPRSVHLALRDGRVRRSHTARRPVLEGPEVAERIPGSRTAQAVERAFEAPRLLGTVRGFDEDPPGVLKRGGLPQRDLRRLAERAGAPLLDHATVLQSAWQAGLIGHDGQEWHPTRDWDVHRILPPSQRWAELVLAWARGHHLAAVVGTPDSSGTGRSLLSDLTRRDGVRTRRVSLFAPAAHEPGCGRDRGLARRGARLGVPAGALRGLRGRRPRRRWSRAGHSACSTAATSPCSARHWS